MDLFVKASPVVLMLFVVVKIINHFVNVGLISVVILMIINLDVSHQYQLVQTMVNVLKHNHVNVKKTVSKIVQMSARTLDVVS